MTFGNSVKSGFTKYFEFSGRAARSEYWYWTLFCVILGIGCFALDVAFDWGNNPLAGSGPLATLASVGTFFPSLAVAVRRLHDTNRSAWWLGAIVLGWIGFGAFAAVLAAGGADAIERFAALLGLAALPLMGFTVALIVFYCLPSDPSANRYGAPVSGGARTFSDTGTIADETAIVRGLKASHWILSGFDSVGNIVRLEFDVAGHFERTFVIGRNRDECDLVIADKGVSRRHAEISVNRSGVFIRDLGSSNGTRVNGQRLTSERVELPVNGTITVGPIELSVFGM